MNKLALVRNYRPLVNVNSLILCNTVNYKNCEKIRLVRLNAVFSLLHA